MPRPLHEPDNRNPTKIQNAFATPVGADRCVGPLHTCRFRPRAHTQVRPYRAIKQYGDIKHVRCLCRVEACLDRRSRKRAGRPSADRRSYLQPQTPPRTSAKRSGVQGHCPCRAGRPFADRRSYLQPQTPAPPSAKRSGSGHWPPAKRFGCALWPQPHPNTKNRRTCVRRQKLIGWIRSWAGKRRPRTDPRGGSSRRAG